MKGKIVITSLIALLTIDTISHKMIAQQTDYPIQPVPFTNIAVSDHFWAPRIKKIHDVTIPHALKMSANRILNFKIAAKLVSGKFSSAYPFDDSDIYKIIEAASYTLYYYPDSGLEATIDSLITIVGLAQEADGYLYTNRTIDPAHPHPWAGSKRWINEEDLSHETYNLGHLFESGVAYYQATGKKNLLDIATKAADLLVNTFGWGKLEKYSGHEVVELGLARLYRSTGDEKYLDLAKFFLDVRGPNGEEYNQANKKVIDQTEAVGHAVRAVYLYSGMADVAALKNDPAYINAIDKIWEDIVDKKIYITGGIGASGGNEGFNGAYNLPNGSAYCETCASVGNIYFNYRLFLLHGDAKYIDVLERTLYNAALSGISLSGDRFFYPNRLLSNGGDQRSEWFECACCPPNIARLIPSVPGYIYAKTADTIYINLFMNNEAVINLNGDTLHLSQKTDYPWNGNIKISVNPTVSKEFIIKVRIPGWARNEAISGGLYKFFNTISNTYAISVNGEKSNAEIIRGYAVLKRVWSQNDSIILDLPMEPRKITALSDVAEDRERVAIQRGPIVFCAEGIDNGGLVLTQNYSKDMALESSFDSTILEGTEVIKTNTINPDSTPGKTITLIPYYLWNNRGASEMQVWLSVRKLNPLPDSLIVINEGAGDYASTNYVSPWENLNSIFDLYDPASSGDKGTGAFGNWMSDGSTVGTWNWVQYNFHKVYTIGSSQVYWWDDNQGITLPDSSYLSYFDKNTNAWKNIESSYCGLNSDCIKWDQYITEFFTPIMTDQIKLNFIGSYKAQGILEWKLYTTKNPVAIENKDINVFSEYNIYPNPVKNVLNILSNDQSPTNISIYDVAGKKVFNDSFTNNIEIKKKFIGGKGLYILELSTEDNVYINKIIIL